MTQFPGYRQLTRDEIDAIEHLKEVGETLDVLVKTLPQRAINADPRWVAIGKTHLQEGMMALVRAVARPDGF